MPFRPVTMTLVVSGTTKTVGPQNVTRSDGLSFSLLSPSTPQFDLGAASLPGQPFQCPASRLVRGVHTSQLTFDRGAIADWDAAGMFNGGQSVRLSMKVDQGSQLLTVNLSRSVVAQPTVRMAAARVVRASSEFIHALLALCRALLTRHRHEQEPELLPANGPQNLE
jgi:hypothetical protein